MEESFNIINLISEYGFPVVAMVGLGYFIYFIWNFVNKNVDPEMHKMHLALIRVIDQTRMLDQDMIRLQQKVNVVLEYREIYGRANQKTEKKKEDE